MCGVAITAHDFNDIIRNGCTKLQPFFYICEILLQKNLVHGQKCHRHCEEAKQSDDIKNADCFVILSRNDTFFVDLFSFDMCSK